LIGSLRLTGHTVVQQTVTFCNSRPIVSYITDVVTANSYMWVCQSKCRLYDESKKGATLTMAITLSIRDRFAKLFHCCKEQ